MNKMNKKGFTLIEMLVVIAIIAILVAIVVPTVTSSTTKAKAATDAANLRTAMSEAQMYVLTNNVPTNTAKNFTAAEVKSVGTACKSTSDLVLAVNMDESGNITAGFASAATATSYTLDLATCITNAGGNE